jgi:tetratricopeptide (TPR) repeat protein
LHNDFPGSLYDFLAQAHAQEAAHKWEAAAESYQLALKLMPGNPALRRRLDTVAARISNAPAPHAPADDETVDASLSLLEEPLSRERLADRYRQLASRSGVSAVPHSAEAAYRAAETFQSLAYLASLRVLEENADSYRAHQLQGESLEAAGNNEEAIVEYQKALKAKPELPSLHFAIGSIYWKTNRLAQAMPELRSELQADPNNAQALYELGDALADTGNTAEAERCFVKAVQLQPEMPEPHLGLEKIYSARADYPKALQHLQVASKLDPLNATPHYRMAGIYRKMGRPGEAEKEMAVFGRLKAAEKKN